MSGFTAEDGSPAVSSADFLAALQGSVAPADEQADPATPPASTTADASTPATAATPAEATPTPPDELTLTRAKLAKLEEEGQRRESTYTHNVRQQREALDAAQRDRDAYAQQLRDQQAHATQATEAAWQAQVQQAQAWVRDAPDVGTQQDRMRILSAAIKEHDADAKMAQADAKLAQVAPVVEELSGLHQQVEIRRFVDTGVSALQTQGAENLATETGVSVDEVRVYLSKPAVVQRLQRALAMNAQAQALGFPTPTTFQDLGEQIRDHFLDLAAARGKAEERQIQTNQQQLVASGATRGDGGGGGAPPREIKSMKDVSVDDFGRAWRGEPLRR